MSSTGPPDWWPALVVGALVLGIIERFRRLGPDKCRSCRGRGGYNEPGSQIMGRSSTWHKCRDCDGTGKIPR